MPDPRVIGGIPLQEFVVVMNEYPPLRTAVQYKFPSLYERFHFLTTTKSKYCPKVYVTCEQILIEIEKNGINSEFETIVSCYRRA